MASFYQGRYCPTCKRNVTADKKDLCNKCGSKTNRTTWFAVFRIDGVQKKLSGYKTKRLAEEAYYQYVNDNSSKPVKKPSDMTVGELYEQYKHYVSLHNKTASIKSTDNALRLHVLPIFENTPVKKLTVLEIEKWQEYIIQKGISYEYKSKIYKIFTAMMNYAVKHNYVESNVVSRVGNFKNTDPKKEMLFWTEQEFITFYKSIDDINWRTFFSFLYFTGCRKGEALALNWNDINFTTNEVSITKSINRQGNINGSYEITTPKNRSSYRNILLPTKLVSIMKEYLDYCKDYVGFTMDCFVFGVNEPFSECTIRENMIKYENNAGVKHIRVHDLRHSHASLLINKGQNILIVSKRLGHSDITQTLNTYSHLMPNTQKEIIEALNIEI